MKSIVSSRFSRHARVACKENRTSPLSFFSLALPQDRAGRFIVSLDVWLLEYGALKVARHTTRVQLYVAVEFSRSRPRTVPRIKERPKKRERARKKIWNARGDDQDPPRRSSLSGRHFMFSLPIIISAFIHQQLSHFYHSHSYLKTALL